MHVFLIMPLYSLHFTSLHFISFHFTSIYFTSLQFTHVHVIQYTKLDALTAEDQTVETSKASNPKAKRLDVSAMRWTKQKADDLHKGRIRLCLVFSFPFYCLFSLQ